MTDTRELLRDAVTFFAASVATALSLSVIFAVILLHMGVPTDAQNFVMATLFVASCVSIPLMALASQQRLQLTWHAAQLELLAATDPLTGLLNRRSFLQAVEGDAERMARTRQCAALVIVDLDYFKAINDEHGHVFGDWLLEQIATVLHSELRGPFDRLARWGGEEFVFLLNNVSLVQAEQICQRVKCHVFASPFRRGDSEVRVTASFGLAPLYAGQDILSCLEQADGALFEAKRNGRNTIMVARQTLAA